MCKQAYFYKVEEQAVGFVHTQKKEGKMPWCGKWLNWKLK
jgi:hypothetical protein